MNFSAYNLPFGSYNLKIDLLKDQVLGKKITILMIQSY